MKRVRLVVAYDGTAYHGWQLQPGETTIESVLNETLTALLGEDIRVIGASRTDSGVHAKGNVAVFDTCHPMPAERIAYALNTRLPKDIRIQSSGEVAQDWHPRHCACKKTYEYRIWNAKMELPTVRLYSYYCYHALDIEKMRGGAAFLLGEHDFKSFCNVRTQVKDTARTIYSLDINREGEFVIIRVCGNGFLYNMVRIIAGTLLSVGMGQRRPEEVEEMLSARDRRSAGPTLPPQALTLIGIAYDS